MNRCVALVVMVVAGCNPFADEAPAPVQAPPVVQVGPQGVTAPGVQIGPQGVTAPGVQVGPNGVVAPGVQVGPNGVVAPGVQVGQQGVTVTGQVVPAGPGGTWTLPASFGVPECDAYAARACNCNGAARDIFCQSANHSFQEWSDSIRIAPAGRPIIADACRAAESALRISCTQ